MHAFLHLSILDARKERPDSLHKEFGWVEHHPISRPPSPEVKETIADDRKEDREEEDRERRRVTLLLVP